MAGSISKLFKVRISKEMLERMDELVDKGIISSYSEAIRRGLEMFLSQYKGRK